MFESFLEQNARYRSGRQGSEMTGKINTIYFPMKKICSETSDVVLTLC